MAHANAGLITKTEDMYAEDTRAACAMDVHVTQPSVVIMTPSCRDPKWGFVNSICAIMDAAHAKGVGVQWMVRPNCSLLPQGRQDMLQSAIDSNFTHGMFIDDDMTFSPHTLTTMLSRNVAALGVNYCRKVMPTPQFTAVGMDGKIVDSRGKEGIEQVRDCALGIFLIDLAVVKQMSAPWFEIRWDDVAHNYVSEDRYFTRKLQQSGSTKYGVNVFIDHDISNKVTHIGDYGYGAE